MDKIKLLQERAEIFRILLEKYASQDEDVGDFLKRITPLFERVMRGEIVPPYDYKLGAYFSNPDFSSLARRYWNHELSNAEARFANMLEGWEKT